MKKKKFITVSMLFLGSFFFIGWRFFESHRFPQKVTIHGKEYSVEIADTDEERALGLGKREFLCDSCAMLFVFDRPGEYSFWMKDMRFPIDIMWLDGEKIVHIERNVSPLSTKILTPQGKADRVLEVNAGEMEDVSVGEKIHW